jgi:O-antigen chain-terminating methyltransferase
VQAPPAGPSGAAEVPALRALDTWHAHRIAEQDLLLHQHLAQLHQVEEELHRCQLYASWIESERNDLRRSWSWRLTAPVRWVGGVFIHPKRTLAPSLDALGQAVRKPLRFLVQMVLRRPELSRYLNTWVMRSPRSHRFFKGLLRSGPLSGSESLLGQGGLPACAEASAVDVASLSQHGRQVYQALCAALDEQGNK